MLNRNPIAHFAGALTVAVAVLSLSGCALVAHPTATANQPPASMTTWDEVLESAPILEHQTVISGRWHVPLSGLINLEHPEAVAAGLVDEDHKIVLPVHIVTHPTHGVFIIDTGVPETVETSGPLISSYLADVQIVKPVEHIVREAEKQSGKTLSGVFMTHFHLDHVLGLAGLPKDTPIFAGPGETTAEAAANALTRSTYQTLMDGRPPIQEWNFSRGQMMASDVGGTTIAAIDVFGDGSFWALRSPGHTSGSTAYLAMTTTGAKLIVGDTSHTQWGWDHGVEPGEYTADHAVNRKSLLGAQGTRVSLPSDRGLRWPRGTHRAQTSRKPLRLDPEVASARQLTDVTWPELQS